MKQLETERLTIRMFKTEDYSAVHSYAGIMENVIYMPWGPNSEEQTRAFIDFSITKAEESPCQNYQYAAVMKSTGALIGGCNIQVTGSEAEIGWILHRGYWKQGFGSEMGNALLKFGFDELNLHRIVAHCDAENYGSYRVMEKIGMRREGLFHDARPANKLSDRKYGDDLSYAMTRDEWEIRKEIAHYNSLPTVFDGFIDIPELSDGDIYLVCTEKIPANPEKKYVPAYEFAVCKRGEKIGNVNLRIGYSEGLYYGGQIGYNIDAKHRGHGYAARACKLILSVAKAHGMTALLITNEKSNCASKRVCEKLGARLIRLARLPEHSDLYKEGKRYMNIFEWIIK